MELTREEIQFLITLCNTFKRAIGATEKKIVTTKGIIQLMERAIGEENLTTDEVYQRLKKGYYKAADMVNTDISLVNAISARLEAELQLVGSVS